MPDAVAGKVVSRRAIAAGLAVAPLAWPAAAAEAAPAEVRSALPTARLIGAGQLRFIGFLVYDARLWAPQPPAEPASEPLALELQYARTLQGAQIAQRSLVEMRRIEPVSESLAGRWLDALRKLLPDVHAGDRLTGVQRPRRSTELFHNGQTLGEVIDAEFTRLFFGIWLSPRTSEPALRARLLGLADASRP